MNLTRTQISLLLTDWSKEKEKQKDSIIRERTAEKLRKMIEEKKGNMSIADYFAIVSEKELK